MVDQKRRRTTASCKECQDLRKHLKNLTQLVTSYILKIDEEMVRPYSHQRGGRIARLTNGLEMANDMARHFGLGEKLEPHKRKIK